MSFLSWGWLIVVQSQLGKSAMSLVLPPVKYLSPFPLIGSVTNNVSPADEALLKTGFQSSPGAGWPSTLPSSSNSPSSWTARTGLGAAIATYCNSSEHNSTAVQRSTRLFRAPVPNAYRNPRDIIRPPRPSPMWIWRYRRSSPCPRRPCLFPRWPPVPSTWVPDGMVVEPSHRTGERREKVLVRTAPD